MSTPATPRPSSTIVIRVTRFGSAGLGAYAKTEVRPIDETPDATSATKRAERMEAVLRVQHPTPLTAAGHCCSTIDVARREAQSIILPRSDRPSADSEDRGCSTA